MKRALVLLAVLGAFLVPAAAAHAEAAFNITALEMGGQITDVAVGDLDGKNGPDIVASLYEGGLSVRLNNGNGTFGEPHLYPTNCFTEQVELADLGGTDNGNVLDGHLDAAIVCLEGSGNTQFLGRLAGDGNGGFGAPDLVPALNTGAFPRYSPQTMALAEVRGPGLPPVPVFTYLEHPGGSEYHRYFCVTYDWVNPTCFTGLPETAAPLVPGVVADARVFSLGGAQGVLDFGPYPEWHASTRDLAPDLPTSTENLKSIAIGDLAGDGPDIITASGTCGCGFQDSPAGGILDISYGNDAVGVPEQVGTKLPTQPGVLSIATGDFDLDGHADLIGDSWSYDASTKVTTGAVFVQAGNGAGGLATPQVIPLSSNEARNQAPIRVADLDGNGAPDAVALMGGKVQVLVNQRTPVPPVPPALAPVVLNPLVGIKGLPKKVTADKKGNLLLGTATNPPTASVDLTVTLPAAKAKKGKGSAAAAKPKKGKVKAVVIGHALIKIPAGKTKALKVHLKGSALAKLKKGPLKAKLAIVVVATNGTRKATSQALTIKPPKAKPKKHKG